MIWRRAFAASAWVVQDSRGRTMRAKTQVMGFEITGRRQRRSDFRVMGREPAISAAPISPSMFESMGRIGEGSLDQICKRVGALLLR